MLASSYFESTTQSASIRTCQESLAETYHVANMNFIQIFVIGLPIPTVRTLVIQANLSEPVHYIKSSIKRKINLEYADFVLVYGNSVISMDASL